MSCGTYVAGSDCVRKFEGTLKVDKGASYFPNMTTLQHVTYVVWTMENHLDQWKHKLWIDALENDEKIKARDYKRLQQCKKAKYAPKKLRYTSSEVTKREYGKSLVLVSDKDKKIFQEIKRMEGYVGGQEHQNSAGEGVEVICCQEQDVPRI